MIEPAAHHLAAGRSGRVSGNGVPVSGRSRSAGTKDLKDFEQIIVENDLSAAKKPEEVILRELAEHGYGENAAFAIKLALEEAITNAFRHGNKCDPSKHIRVRFRVTAEKVEIEVSDEGEGFCPEEVPDPTQPGYIDRPHGRGIMLMRAYLDEVVYNGLGNSVRMVKVRQMK